MNPGDPLVIHSRSSDRHARDEDRHATPTQPDAGAVAGRSAVVDERSDATLSRGLELLERASGLLVLERPNDILELATEALSILQHFDQQHAIGRAHCLIARSRLRLAQVDHALDHARQATALLNAAGDVAGEAMARRCAGQCLRPLGHSIEAMQELNLALELFRQCGYWLGVGMTLSCISAHHRTEGDGTLSLAAALESVEALSLVDTTAPELTVELVLAYRAVSSAYIELNQHKVAREYLDRAIAIAPDFCRASIYMELGVTIRSEDPERALMYFRLAYRAHSRDHAPDLRALAVTALNLGVGYREAGRHRLALRYLRDAVARSEASGDKAHTAYALCDLSSVMLALDEPDESLALIRRASVIAESLQTLPLTQWVHYRFYWHYKQVKDFALSLEHCRLSQELIREMSDRQSVEAMETLRLSFEHERALREQEEARRAEVVRAVIDAQESERDRISRDLREGLGQLLAAVQLNLEHCRSAVTDRQALESSLTHTTNVLSRAVADMRSISHALGSSTLLELGLVAALEELLTGVMEQHATRFELIVSGLGDRLSSGIESGLFRIVQELVANIIRHAKASEGSVQIVRTPDEIRLSVEDNGVGFDTGAAYRGLGLRNIAARIEALDGRVSYDSTKGHGTTVTVVVGVDA